MRDAEALRSVAKGRGVEGFLRTETGRALARAAAETDVDLGDWQKVFRRIWRERGAEASPDAVFVESLALSHDDLLTRLLDEGCEIDLEAVSTAISLCCGSARGEGCCGEGMTCHDGGGCGNPAERLDDGAVREEV